MNARRYLAMLLCVLLIGCAFPAGVSAADETVDSVVSADNYSSDTSSGQMIDPASDVSSGQTVDPASGASPEQTENTVSDMPSLQEEDGGLGGDPAVSPVVPDGLPVQPDADPSEEINIELSPADGQFSEDMPTEPEVYPEEEPVGMVEE